MGLLAVIDGVAHRDASSLIIAGLLLLIGFVAHMVGRRVHVPRVTLLMLIGFVASPSVFNLISPEVVGWFPLVTHVALGMVGFQLGEQFWGRKLRRTGKMILTVSLAGAILATGAVLVAMTFSGIACVFHLGGVPFSN